MQKQKHLAQASALVWFALVLFAACSPAPTPTNLAQITATRVPTNSPAPSFTPTASVTPTATRTRTRTLTQTRTPTKTRTPETPSATPDELATHIARAATGSAHKTPASVEKFRSPNNKWQAQIIVRACNATPTPNDWGYEELRIKNLATGQETLADVQGIGCGGLGAYGLQGFFWSNNSRYFYYTTAREGVPDGCGFWERPYLVFDTQTLQTQWLGGGPLSPDKTRLATWHYTPLGATNSTVSILIWDLNRGEIARHEVQNDLIEGPIAWAPDGNALVFLQTENYCPAGDTFLTRLDAPEYQVTLSEKLAVKDFVGVRWLTPNELILTTFQRGQEWRYVFADKKLKELPRTPNPWAKYISAQHHFSFQYPAHWDSECCRIGAAPGTAEYIITLANPTTAPANTGAPFNGFAVFVEPNPNHLSLRAFVENEKQRMKNLPQNPDMPTMGTETEFVLGNREGVLLKGYIPFAESYIYVPLADDKILIVVANMEQNKRRDNMLEKIFATFEFE